MPFYDLKCTNCGNTFNIMAKMKEKEDKLIICPQCGSNELESIFTNINIITKKTGSAESGGCGAGCSHCHLRK